MKDSDVVRQDARTNELLLAEQTSLAFGSIYISLAANIVVGSILAVLMWPVADQRIVMGWWLFSSLVSLLRAYHASLYNRDSSDHKNQVFWLNRFRLGMYLAAISWGLATTFLFMPDSTSYQAMLAFVIAGMTAGAVTMLSQLWRTLLAYLLIPIVPLVIQFWLLDTHLGKTMAVVVALYLAMMIAVARKAHEKTLQNIRLRIESSLHEKVLEASEQKFRLLYESVADAIFIMDLKGNFIDVNPVAYERLGYSKDEFLTMHISALDTPEYAERVPERMAMLINHGHATFEAGHVHKDGTVMPVEVSARLVNLEDEQVIFSVVRDLTERNRAQEELKQSERRFRDISLSMADWIWEVDANGHYSFVSGKVKELLGFEPEEVIGKTPFDLMSKNEAERVGNIFQRAVNKKLPLVNLENWNKTRDGKDVCMLTNGVPVIGENGELLGYRGVDQDITSRRRAEDELRKLSRAIEFAGESVLITDKNGVIEYVNPAFSHMSGYAVDEAIGKTPAILKSGEHDEVFYREFWSTINNGKVWQGTMVDRRKDGSTYSAMMTVAPIMDEAGMITHFVSMQMDISEYKELEESFQQSQKMEAIGTLVGGIAHDFNNMLAALLGNLYLAKSVASNDKAMTDRLNRIESVSQRAADMIGQLLTFARKGKVEMVPLPMIPLLKETFKLARPSIPENIDIHLEILDEDIVVAGDATQLQQVLLNLITNASHALDMTEQPCIEIGLKAFTPDKRFKQIHTDVEAEAFALLYVRDNGCGIARHLQEKVFEPFFTTREQGKGSGLGLAMVHGAVKTHKGAVEINSKPGHGTCVCIYLPLEQEPKLLSVNFPGPQTEQGDGEGILLVDDEELVLEVNAEVLQSLGYQTFVAKDGIDGLQVYNEHAAAINLAMIDLVMPKMGGMELLSHLRQLNDELPIILMTGYDREQVLPANVTPEKCMVLNKPIEISKMSKAVFSMLEKESPN